MAASQPPLSNVLQYRLSESPSNVQVFSQLEVPKDQPIRVQHGAGVLDYRQNFAYNLINHAVRVLSEIWCPEDIPIAFIGPTKGEPEPSAPLPSLLSSTGAKTNSTLPLKNFVHEVLKRSRTSGSILQIALCYLEAVRSKIPDIAHDEKHGFRCYFMLESTILLASEAELEIDRILTNHESQQPFVLADDIVKTVQLDQSPDMTDLVPLRFSGLGGASIACVEPPLATVVSASLPSPLLCPRRTFLASLILASKFLQDKCYSNRAWAKLSGLPPREIGRCERALGQALDWRLWVGKNMTSSEPGPTISAVAGLAVPVRTSLIGDSLPKITFPYVASKSRSNHSGPHLHSLSNTPSTSATLTVPVSSFEDSSFPFSCIVDPKLPKSAHIELAGKMALEMAQLQARLVAVANVAPEISPPGIETSGHVSLGLASVH